MRIQPKRRPPSRRRHANDTTDAMSQSFEDDTVSAQARSHGAADDGRLMNGGDDDSWLSAHVPMSHSLDFADTVTPSLSSIINSQNSKSGSGTVGRLPEVARSAPSHAAAAATAVDNVHSSVTPHSDTPHSVTPGNFSSVAPHTVTAGDFDSKPCASLTPSHDVDDIFADSSLFATCKFQWCMYIVVVAPNYHLIFSPTSRRCEVRLK